MTDITRGFHLTVSAPAKVPDDTVRTWLDLHRQTFPGWTVGYHSADRHQGYANYPTFTVAQWFENDRGRMALARSSGKYYAGEEYPDVRLAEWLREYTDARMPEGDDVSGSLLNYALGTVDWLELAREFMKEEGE